MKVRVVEVRGLGTACKAVRLSFNSQSDQHGIVESNGIELWKDDVELLIKLIKNGDSHAKVMRMVQVWLDIKAPRYWWAEWDTYKVGTTAMSESTMHTCTKKPLTPEDFGGSLESDLDIKWLKELNDLIDEKDWYALKQRLPESFLQRRIVNLNYQVLRHMYLDRKNHRLPEWHTFLTTILASLPFPPFITGGES